MGKEENGDDSEKNISSDSNEKFDQTENESIDIDYVRKIIAVEDPKKVDNTEY